MAQPTVQDDGPAAGLLGPRDRVRNRADQGGPEQVVRPILHRKDRDQSPFLAPDYDILHNHPPLQPTALTSTRSRLASSSCATAVTRSSPNCPKSEEGRSYSKIARPTSFSYSTTRSGAYSEAGSWCCVILEAVSGLPMAYCTALRRWPVICSNPP